MSKRLGHLFQIIALISISAIYPRVAGQAIPPNIQYMQRGYNIYFGNPLPSAGTLVDPGFGDIIFDFVKSTSSDSEDEFADQVYLAPEGVLITVGQDCSVESDASELDSMEDYASLLSLQASVQGSFDIASFSASGEYQKVQDVLSSSQSAAYTMSGTCTVYEATMQSLSPLSKPFKADVMSINASDPTSYYSFFQKYGTHYVSDITMGAKVSMIRTFTASSLQSLQSQNISIQAAAQASFGLNFGLSGAYSNENSEADAFAQSASYSDLTTIACEPPSNISSWYSAIKNPLPISYKLSNISDLFIISNFDNDTDATLFGQIVDNLPVAFENYYSYLETINATSITPSQSTNASSTVTLGSCRLCAQTCGGDYTVDNGVFGLNGQSPSDFATFEDGCGGGSLSEGNSLDNGVHLCCLPEVPNVVEGSVKLCSSCGGDFPRAIGDFGIASAGWVETYGEACAGDLQPETASDARITVCGALPTPCMFCILCGGHFPEVVGSFSPQLIPSEINHFGGPAMGCQSVSSSGAQNANEVLTQVGFNLCCAAANTQVNVLTS